MQPGRDPPASNKAPLFIPSADEFVDPVRYMLAALRQASNHGICCVRPPKDLQSRQDSASLAAVRFPVHRQALHRLQSSNLQRMTRRGPRPAQQHGSIGGGSARGDAGDDDLFNIASYCELVRTVRLPMEVLEMKTSRLETLFWHVLHSNSQKPEIKPGDSSDGGGSCGGKDVAGQQNGPPSHVYKASGVPMPPGSGADSCLWNLTRLAQEPCVHRYHGSWLLLCLHRRLSA
jgi:hypothetical protein